MLGQVTGLFDVVFGRLVSGRSALPADMQHVVGQCINALPVRARFEIGQTREDLLASIQSQFFNGLPFGTIGFDDLLNHCTAWPKNTQGFGLSTHYRNVEVSPSIDISGSICESGSFEGDPFALNGMIQHGTIGILAMPQGEELVLRIFASSEYNKALIDGMLKRLCDILALYQFQ